MPSGLFKFGVGIFLTAAVAVAGANEARTAPFDLDRSAVEQIYHPTAWQASFDWIYIWRLADFDTEDGTYGDTGLYIPENSKAGKLEQSPRGVVISAGLEALNHLRSNGIDIGHTVQMMKWTPQRIIVDIVKGHEIAMHVIRDGDVTGSEELTEALLKGECKVELKTFKDQFGQDVEKHFFIDKNGKQWLPTMPWMPADT